MKNTLTVNLRNRTRRVPMFRGNDHRRGVHWWMNFTYRWISIVRVLFFFSAHLWLMNTANQSMVNNEHIIYDGFFGISPSMSFPHSFGRQNVSFYLDGSTKSPKRSHLCAPYICIVNILCENKNTERNRKKNSEMPAYRAWCINIDIYATGRTYSGTHFATTSPRFFSTTNMRLSTVDVATFSP